MKAKTELKEHQAALLTLLDEFDRVCRKLDIPYVLFAGSMLGAVRHEGFIPWDDDLDVMLLREDYERLLREGDSVLNRERFYLQKEFSEHWPMFFSKLRLNGTTCLEKYYPKDPLIHQGVYMDIFPCDNAYAGRIGQRIQFYASKVVIAKGLYALGYVTNSVVKKLFIAFCRILPMKPFLHFVTRGKKTGMVHSFLGGASRFEKNVYDRSCFEKRREVLFAGRCVPISACSETLLTQLYGDYMRLPAPEERRCKEHAILVDLERSYEHYEHYRDGMIFDELTRSIR